MRLVIKTTSRRQAGAGARTQTFAWIAGRQRELSDRLHAASDDRACRHGWEITTSTRRLGFGARTYRDPRFECRRRRFATTADSGDKGDYFDASRKSKGRAIRTASRLAARRGAQRHIRSGSDETGE